MKLVCLVPLAFAFALMNSAWVVAVETIRIGIGHQSTCTDTYTAGIIVEQRKLFEKHLPISGKYKDVKFILDWQDYTSGPPITQWMLANKIQIGVMGDYPLIVNGAKFQSTASLQTHYISGTGYNLRGSGNGIVVPVNSLVQSIAGLVGKRLSVPSGSTVWGMVLKALTDNQIALSEVDIINQSPTFGAANIARGKIDAHADFCPWTEIMEFRGTGRKIYDGGEAITSYLQGVVVRNDFAEKYPEVVIAFSKAIIEAGIWVENNAVRAATELEEWTGIEKEVQYLYFSRGGLLTLDPTIKPAWIETLKFDHRVLKRENKVTALDFDSWIDDQYLRAAFEQLGLDYQAQLEPLIDPLIANLLLPPAEVWHAQQGIIEYAKIGKMLSDLNKFAARGESVFASYVYDKTTGVKMFAHVASYKVDDRGFSTFIRKSDAGMDALSFEQALKQSQ
ncbi:MAG: ABC transporter substrate-binding protein [Pseudomonadales bacterium]|nr:ABC transporter substrate-binding protein [Pseudomonadales bacterium]